MALQFKNVLLQPHVKLVVGACFKAPPSAQGLAAANVCGFSGLTWTWRCLSSSSHNNAMQRDNRSRASGKRHQEREINMVEEVKKFEVGKRWLARMMGEDPEHFTNEDIQKSLQYLLPSGLFGTDARPVMKHPSDLYPEKKESTIGANGRPVSPAFYTGQPHYHNLIYEIYEKTDHLNKMLLSQSSARSSATQVPSISADDELSKEIARWVNKSEMESILNEKIVDKQLELLLFRLKRLAKHPMADGVQEFLVKFQRPVIQANVNIMKGEVDDLGRGHAIGYRKQAIAEVWVSRGTGQVTVNDRSFIDYFPRLEHRQQIMFPFLAVDQLRQYDVVANTISGGLSGQSGAIRLAVSRALASLSDVHEKSLLKANLLLRDYRRLERKKPGQKRARKKFAWVKR